MALHISPIFPHMSSQNNSPEPKYVAESVTVLLALLATVLLSRWLRVPYVTGLGVLAA